jgi:hypothetical protein
LAHSGVALKFSSAGPVTSKWLYSINLVGPDLTIDGQDCSNVRSLADDQSVSGWTSMAKMVQI